MKPWPTCLEHINLTILNNFTSKISFNVSLFYGIDRNAVYTIYNSNASTPGEDPGFHDRGFKLTEGFDLLILPDYLSIFPDF